MPRNEGLIDRIIRVVAGLAIAALGIAFHSWWGLLAIVPLLTAGVGTCPLYIPFKLSTNRKA